VAARVMGNHGGLPLQFGCGWVHPCVIRSFIPHSAFPIPHSRDSLPAIRTIPEIRRDRVAALGTILRSPEFKGAYLGVTGFIEDAATAVALQEGLSPLDGNQGNEEETDIMVQAFQPG
jgi:hypothetical protein